MYKAIGVILLFVHAGLGVWALGGMVEWFAGRVPWKPFSNPEFPSPLLFVHWMSVLFASTIFIYGYFSRWSGTPLWMSIAYGIMAVVCVVETFGYMTSKFKYVAMGAEYTAYVVIVMILYSAGYQKIHFDTH